MFYRSRHCRRRRHAATPRDAKMGRGRVRRTSQQGCESRRYRTTQFAVFGAEQRDLAGTHVAGQLYQIRLHSSQAVAFYVPPVYILASTASQKTERLIHLLSCVLVNAACCLSFKSIFRICLVFMLFLVNLPDFALATSSRAICSRLSSTTAMYLTHGM